MLGKKRPRANNVKHTSMGVVQCTTCATTRIDAFVGPWKHLSIVSVCGLRKAETMRCSAPEGSSVEVVRLAVKARIVPKVMVSPLATVVLLAPHRVPTRNRIRSLHQLLFPMLVRTTREQHDLRGLRRGVDQTAPSTTAFSDATGTRIIAGPLPLGQWLRLCSEVSGDGVP